jgi:hypothetical protein
MEIEAYYSVHKPDESTPQLPTLFLHDHCATVCSKVWVVPFPSGFPTQTL